MPAGRQDAPPPATTRTGILNSTAYTTPGCLPPDNEVVNTLVGIVVCLSQCWVGNYPRHKLRIIDFGVHIAHDHAAAEAL